MRAAVVLALLLTGCASFKHDCRPRLSADVPTYVREAKAHDLGEALREHPPLIGFTCKE